jgi:hypothetical protein
MSVHRVLLVLACLVFSDRTWAQDAFLLVTVTRAPQITAAATGANALPSPEISRRLFPLDRRSRAFQAALPGLEGQQIVVRFIGVVLPNGLCAVANYQAIGLAAPQPGKPFGEGSSIEANRTGFALPLGGTTARSISAQGDHGQITYRLAFTAIKVFGAVPSEKDLERSGGWF